MAYRWETAHGTWLEGEHNRFEKKAGKDGGSIDWQGVRNRLPDVAQLLGASLPSACAHAPIYPEGFAFCPECGASLRMADMTRRPAWWGATSATLGADDFPLPRHVPHGLPQTAQPLAAVLETRPAEPARGQADLRIPAPPNAICVFAAATFGFAAQRVLALAYTRNVLQYWDPLAAHWQVLAPDAGTADLRFDVSQYAWLPIVQPKRRGEVALVPSGQGLYRLIVNPITESFHTEAILEVPLVASPGAVGSRIACLILGGAHYVRTVRLWTAAPDGADPESMDVLAEDDVPVPTGGWARPYSYDGQLCWLHDEGQLLWRPGSAPRWLPWPFPWQPRLQCGGPVRSRDGRLWLLGHDGESYSFRELGTTGIAQVQPIGGARLGFGTLLFRRGHQVKDDPWSVENVEDQTRGDVYVLPLLENVVAARSQPSGLVLRFRYPGLAEKALTDETLAGAIVEWIGQRNVILDEVARLKEPGACVPFVYDGKLWLHHPTWNEIRGWHLKDLGMTRAALCALLGVLALPAHATSHVFLVQNSGWMEPFFTDPSSQYKPLVAEVVTAVTQPGDALVLAAFNQGLPGAPSPRALMSRSVDDKPQREVVRAALAPLTVARKPNSTALADTDLGEAVGSAMTQALGGKPGLVWLFTNNKNSPNNDQATALRNREFYQLIHAGPAITKALAFPLHMPVTGERYRANGLMVYVFAVQEQGRRELDTLLRSGRLQQVITEPPARLKPLDADTVRLVPTRVENVPGVSFAMLPDGRLRADVDAQATANGPAPAARISWRLENAIYPYTIAHAHIAAQSSLAGAVKPLALAQEDVSGLAPGKPQPLASTLTLPVANLPGKWSLAALQSAGSAQVLPGRIDVQLSEQKLELSQAFRQRMATLFPGDPLPDIFTPPERIQGSRAVLPVEVRLQYGAAPLLAMFGGLFAAIGGLVGGLLVTRRSRKVTVTIEGELRTVLTKAGARTPLYDNAGNMIAELHSTAFGDRLAAVREGAQVRLGR